MFSGCMMFDYIGWREVSDLIKAAFTRTVAAGIVTYDFARLMEGATEVPTSGFADALIARL
jgi:isocitrate dehydrogenase